MKRYFFAALVVLAVVLSVTALVAYAQTKGQGSVRKLSFDKPIPVADLVRTIAVDSGLNYEFEVEPVGNFQGNLEGSLPEILTKVLGPDYTFEVRDFTLYVRRAGTNAPATQDRRQSRVAELINRYPTAFNPDGTSGYNQQTVDLMAETYQANNPWNYVNSYTGSYNGYYANNGFYGVYGYNPLFFEQMENRHRYGLLKIDGPDKYLRDVRILIDDADVAVASKSNNWWNSPVVLTAGNHMVEFRREKDGKIVGFRRQVAIQPMSVQGVVYLRVTGNEFESAQEIYEYQQHRFVENPDGKLEKLPATPPTTPKK